MELVDYRGSTLPLIAFPGGNLVLGCGAGGRLDLRNVGDEPYDLRGTAIYLNPHYTLVPPLDVSVSRSDNGLPDGMCFEAEGEQDWVGGEVRDALYVELGAALASALRDDPDLARYVLKVCAEEDLLKAEHKLEASRKSLAEAERTFQEDNATVTRMRLRVAEMKLAGKDA